MKLDFFRDRAKEIVLLSAAYYVLLGLTGLIAPGVWAAVLGVQSTAAGVSLIVQVSGVIFLALGIVSFIAATDPIRHWLVPLLGAIIHLIDTLLVLYGYASGQLNLASLFLLIFGDLFWVVVFGALVYSLYRDHIKSERQISLGDALQLRPFESPFSLAELSDKHTLLLVLLRHAGCTYCRAHLASLAKESDKLASLDVSLILVSTSEASSMKSLAEKYGLGSAVIVSDPDRLLYQALHIKRGTLSQIIGFRQIIRAISRRWIQDYGIGWLEGDAFQLHGAAIIRDRKLLALRAASEATDMCSIEPLLAA